MNSFTMALAGVFLDSMKNKELKTNGIHLGESCCPETIGRAQVIGNFGIELQLGSNSPNDIRKAGYSVAVHNDYKMHEIDYTFWLFTKLVDNQLIAFKGEGISDIIALDQIREQILKFEKNNSNNSI